VTDIREPSEILFALSFGFSFGFPSSCPKSSGLVFVNTAITPPCMSASSLSLESSLMTKSIEVIKLW